MDFNWGFFWSVLAALVAHSLMKLMYKKHILRYYDYLGRIESLLESLLEELKVNRGWIENIYDEIESSSKGNT